MAGAMHPNMILRILVIAILCLSAVIVSAQTPADIEKKIDALISRIALEEKLGQMSQTNFRHLDEARKDEIQKNAQNPRPVAQCVTAGAERTARTNS